MAPLARLAAARLGTLSPQRAQGGKRAGPSEARGRGEGLADSHFGKAPLRRAFQSWLRYALAALILIAADRVEACQICAAAFVVTPGQKLDAADQAVLAEPLPGGNRFRVVEIIKGNDIPEGLISEEVLGIDAAALRRGRPLLLLHDALIQYWSSIGSIGAEHAEWLRRLAATSSAAGMRVKANWPRATQTVVELTEFDWRTRVALVLPYLEHSEPLAAEIAYGELARAPYAALRLLKPQLQASKVASSIEDPKLATRRSTYLLLLGIAGDSNDATRLERRIDAAWQSHDATNLAAMLAADLELQGPSRVAWMEKAYFADRTRTLPEIEAALLALSVHGSTNAAVSRERVIQAYRLFIRERKAMAGFVAQQLADWGYWDATADYVELLKSDVVKDPASHFAVVAYLQRSPHAAAKAALQSLASKSR
jgi:hypothetical protein